MKVHRPVLFVAVLLSACGGKSDDSAGSDDATGCESGALQCNDDVLEICDDGAWVEEDDCPAAGLECHSDMGEPHCM